MNKREFERQEYIRYMYIARRVRRMLSQQVMSDIS